MTADDLADLEIVGGHKLRLRAVALALRGPPLQWTVMIMMVIAERLIDGSPKSE